jgi:hypothetical protein
VTGDASENCSASGEGMSGWSKAVAWLFAEPTRLRERKQKQEVEAEKKRKQDEEEAAKAAAGQKKKRLKLSIRRRSVELSAPADLCCGKSGSAGSGQSDAGTKTEDKLGSAVWKVAGAFATGITATGAIVAVGAAVIWIRFNEVGIPATQAVSVQPRGEALVLGAQETIIFVGIALVAVLLVYFADPKGVVRNITLLLLLVLFLAATVDVIWRTHLTPDAKFGLCVLALFLLLGSIAIGHRSGTSFWPLALAVFVSALLFSAAVGILVVKQQRFVQGVAILRGAGDAGLTGVYIAATDKTIYFAQNVATNADEKPRMAMMEAPREGATYAVGPLEPRSDAALRETLMLDRLIANRERAGSAPEEPPAEPETDLGTKEEGEAKVGEAEVEGGGEQKTTGSGEAEAKTVAEAFGEGAVTVHERVEAPWNCLVRYASAGSGLLGKWWTSCEAARKLEREGATLFELRDDFALPSRFQPAYDMRVEGGLPEGKPVTYMTGPVAPQCEHAKPLPCGHRWRGGAVEQLYLAEPQLVEGAFRQCTESALTEKPEWSREACSPQG